MLQKIYTLSNNELAPMLAEFERFIKESLYKFGIDVECKGSYCVLSNKKPHFSFETSTFNSTPRIFKELKVVAHGTLENKTNNKGEEVENVYSIQLMLDYVFKRYDLGFNGTHLGDINVTIFVDEETKKVTCHNLGLTI